MNAPKRWFAWYPVRLHRGGWCWLRIVEWRRVQDFDFKRGRLRGFCNLYVR